MFSIFVLAATMLAAPENLLHDPGFSEGLAHWRVEAGNARADVVEADGATCASITAATMEGFPRIVQDFVVEPGALYGAEALALDAGITGGYGAYMTVEFTGADGRRIHFEQSSPALTGAGWTQIIARSVAPEGAVRGMVCLVLRGAGTARFRSPVLVKMEPATAASTPEEVHVRFGAPLPGPFLGLGFEDDGWLANKDNALQGVTEADIQRVHARMEWMQPATARMFAWYRDFNPSGDWETLDFETDNMHSRYRALDVYQRIGAVVNITGVEWEIKQPWAQPEAMARAIGELFTELIRKRGYTCVKQWTLTNEPNTHFLREGATFDTYKLLHLLVAKEFAARGLDVAIVGSDDTNGGLPWFRQCVETEDYFNTASIMASHFYLQQDSLRAAKYNILDRTALLAGRRPFVIAEFGFQDSRSDALTNPLMDEFEYALLASAFAVDALGRGVAGLTIWCLQELHYPVGYMNYGLFHYKDKDWAPRPVFYAWSGLMRAAKPGMPVQAPAVPLHPDLAIARVGATVFFVNQSATPVRLVFEDGALSEARVIDEGSLPGPGAAEAAIRVAAEGRPANVEQNTFTVPGRAFGRAW